MAVDTLSVCLREEKKRDKVPPDITGAYAVLPCYLGCREGHLLGVVVQKAPEVDEEPLGGFGSEESHRRTLRPNGCLANTSKMENDRRQIKRKRNMIRE